MAETCNIGEENNFLQYQHIAQQYMKNIDVKRTLVNSCMVEIHKSGTTYCTSYYVHIHNLYIIMMYVVH